MSWKMNTGMTKAWLSGTPNYKNALIKSGLISLGDGDGSGGRDTINLTSGLDVFDKHAWLMLCNPDGVNTNLFIKCLDVAANKIEVPAGTFSASEASGTLDIALIQVNHHSLRGLFENSILDLYGTNVRPTDADLAETGVKVLSLSLNGGAFLAGDDENGINLGTFSGLALKQAIDPDTGAKEVMNGVGLAAAGTGMDALWGRWYANSYVTGASSEAIHMDGVVGVSLGGGTDIAMINGTTVVQGIFSEVSDISFNVSAA